MIERVCALSLLLVWSVSAFAQTSSESVPKRPTPTVADFVYGKDSERQRLDFWKAESDRRTPLVLMIHGGGWVKGDKSDFDVEAIQPLLDAGISVAAINYRFIPQAMQQGVEPPVKACIDDAARALQTIRSKASEWNINPQRIGATGRSAGACTSLWLAFHDDLAEPASSDPIARESTRLACAAAVVPQVSFDPIVLKEWVPNAEYGGNAFGFWAEGRTRPEEFALLSANRETVLPWIKEYSPIEFVSRDDPPVFVYSMKDAAAPTVGQPQTDPTHTGVYGIKLAEKMREAGLEVELAYKGENDSNHGLVNEFLIKTLKGN